MIRTASRLGAVPLVTALAFGAIAATPKSPSISDSFRIGTSGVLCTAQTRPLDPNLRGMFDRGYAVICRDAASAVGTLYALRATDGDPLKSIAARRPADIICDAPTSATIEGLSAVSMANCTSTATKVSYHSYSVMRGKTVYVAEGLGGYDSVLKLGLRSIVTDRLAEGEVKVASTSADDPAAFARVQAGSLDRDTALNEAYLRNNVGSFAEAAEFFETLAANDTAAQRGGVRASEYLVNDALQQSNLGNFPVASELFQQLDRSAALRDPVISRLARNFRAINLLNQQRGAAALAELARPVPAIRRDIDLTSDLGTGTISPSLADLINRENGSLERLGGIDGRLRPSERAQILDGQAALLRGVALRIGGRYPEALAALKSSSALISGVRDGRVVSTGFLRSENFAEVGRNQEALGNFDGAEASYVLSMQILEVDYPKSSAGLAAKARLAAYLSRRGQADRAIALYGDVVAESERLPGSAATMRKQLAPYFSLLIDRTATDPKAATAMFAATQIMLRPGVAQTQAVLARELSGGSDEASQLFRQSVAQTRDIARTDGEISRLITENPQPSAEIAAEIALARTRLAALQSQQTIVQSKLGEFQRYRVLAPPMLTLQQLQAALRPGEGYYQLRLIGQDAVAMFITPDGVRAAKLSMTAKDLEDAVASLRSTIVTLEAGNPQTYPFDVALAHRLYEVLFKPFGDATRGVTNLIWEPDGALLQLPPNLLVMERAGVDAYAARVTRGGDAFDFTGVAWLGRDRDISTAVSPRSFVDVRAIPAAKGSKPYLGLGQNAIPTARLTPTVAGDAIDCSWPLSAWRSPISPDELLVASQAMGVGRLEVITGVDFTDTAIKDRTDLSDFRILHFATHGLVTAPRPQCPARPALLTSFGADGSDGLLSFREIFDLKLDADVVILSACDTAGMATIAATREAGVSTGGNFALDGLVRAFVGAGARTVIASHWPVPDDFGATKRLIQGVFSAAPGTPMATAMRASQRKMMDDPVTSHPYYWAAFAIVGDGGRVIR
jgi:CHAT domain-containing protein